MADFDLKLINAKQQLTDALMLPQRIKPLGPPPNQQPPSPVRAGISPMTAQIPAGAPGPFADQQQQPMATRMMGMQAGMQAPVGPGMGNINVMMSPGGDFQGAQGNVSMPMGGGNFDVGAALDDTMKLQNLQARYNQGPFSVGGNYTPGQGAGLNAAFQQGPFSASGGYDPNRGAYGSVGFRQSFQEGGLATSIHSTDDYHQRDMDFINTRNQHMREIAGKTAYAKGGLAMAQGGDIVVNAPSQAAMPMPSDRQYSIPQPALLNVGYAPRRADTADIAYSMPPKPATPVQLGVGSVGGVMKPSYIGSQADLMRTMDLNRNVGRAPKGVGASLGLNFAKGGLAAAGPEGMSDEDLVSLFFQDGNNAMVIDEVNRRIEQKLLRKYNGDEEAARAEFQATSNPIAILVGGYAKGGGVWTRKEGQNPEGGLNAKGRASLRAQGHDIKPPVSAKQAKKSPKAAARRSSFCARMSGMPGPMKDEKGRPTRKALSLRKWDC